MPGADDFCWAGADALDAAFFLGLLSLFACSLSRDIFMVFVGELSITCWRYFCFFLGCSSSSVNKGEKKKWPRRLGHNYTTGHLGPYLECPLFRVSFIQSVHYPECPLFGVYFIWSFLYSKCPLFEVSFIRSVIYSECPLFGA